MTAPAARLRFAAWPALLAVALLTFAGVRSTVMRAQAAAPGGCVRMAGMAMGEAAGRPDKSRPAAPASCDYCAAAAHVPIHGVAVHVAPPASTVVFARYAAPAALGPRGPPFRPPTARGPPSRLSA